MSSKNSVFRVAQATLAAIVFAAAVGVATAQEDNELSEVKVVAQKPVVKAGKTASGREVETVQLTRRVSYADLDLSTRVGSDELRKRIEEASKAVCKDLLDMYPGSTADGVGELGREGSCVKKAMDGGMKEAKAHMAAADKQIRDAKATPK